VGCLAAQMVSYALLIPFYLAASVNTIGSAVAVVPLEQILRNPDATLLFVSDAGAVYRGRLGGSGVEPIEVGEDFGQVDFLALHADDFITSVDVWAYRFGGERLLLEDVV